ncbi:deaminase [Nocardia sp. 852002-20019_SCH5090214]|uniref:dihydrofolate reductase family protein n=1 Tax=Nocardia sp. 852002-20019_SCH5090214 TaxID=1834087 RepID=UPI0007EAEB19|nr:dihydrofolate reductase family protein [Nocardia sp. 852002-20019_SCH5090214]OBA67065.1 deaminase [Nocardia sp. 852002-20019_SCH5090214]
MPRLRVHNLSISLDGYVAGPDQGPDHPLGVGGERLHEWVFVTRTGRRMIGQDGGSTGIDDEQLAAGEANVGATIMGRNMFGPVRGEWPDDSWTGWWGANPPYHHPVFVLTHHPRPALEMDGGTTFHFVDDTPDNVLARAFSAAGGKDVRLGGGAATVRRFLRAGLVDDLHLALVPTLLGAGERLYDGLGSLPCYTASPARQGDNVTHFHLTKAADQPSPRTT